jgi:hypothetical protein
VKSRGNVEKKGLELLTERELQRKKTDQLGLIGLYRLYENVLRKKAIQG